MFPACATNVSCSQLMRYILIIVLFVCGQGLHADAATEAPVITSPTTMDGTVGVAFSYQITATQEPTGYSAANLPSGLALNPTTGLISGTPTVAGFSNVTINASNAFGTGTGAVNITIAGTDGPPVISSPTSATATVGVAFNYQIIASHSPFNYSASGLPNGLSLNVTTGLISGTPTLAGAWTATIGATNLQGTATESLSITVNPTTPPPGTQPQITSALTANGQVGTPFSYAIQATNSPTSFDAAGLPAGLIVDVTTGIISGTPTVSAITNVTISATNASGTDSRILQLSIATSTGTPPTGTPSNEPVREGSSCGVGSGLSALVLGLCCALQMMLLARQRSR